MPGSIELRKMRVLAIGLARTGVATALFCAKHNAIVTATDSRPEEELGNVPELLREAGVTLELGGHQEKTFLAQDLIIPSPGVPADDPLLAKARSKGITVWSEIELAYRFLEGEMIGEFFLQALIGAAPGGEIREAYEDAAQKFHAISSALT